MNDVPGGIIAIGTRLCSEGGIWEVAEITPTGVVLRDGAAWGRPASVTCSQPLDPPA